MTGLTEACVPGAHNETMNPRTVALVAALAASIPSAAAVYDVGPGQPYTAIGEVPWESLGPGDEVRIHWRSEPYREKWVICRRGTEAEPIVVRGVPSSSGERPVVSGDGATTRRALDFWNEERGLLKIGGASVPADTLPAWIVVEGIEFRSARPAYAFTGDDGSSRTYASNAAAIYVEKAQHLVIRDCVLTDSGNGLFIGAYSGQTQEILIQANRIEGNGIEGSYYEHNTYTSARGIIYELNLLWPLRDGCGGNNLKDRSAGLVVRCNWIEGGNRQLDLVDAEDSDAVAADPRYHETFVWGNVLIERADEGNSQIVHYGGDSGDTSIYRKGTLYFFHNTVISRRAGNTTLLRLSTNDEHADIRNTVVRTTVSGPHLALLASNGTALLTHCWLPTGWVTSHDAFSGTLTDDATSISGNDPGFADEGGGDYRPGAGSPLVDAGGPLPPAALPTQAPVFEYVPNLGWRNRPFDGVPDTGAFEAGSPPCGDTDGDGHVTPADLAAWLRWRFPGAVPAGELDCDGSGSDDAPDLAWILPAAWGLPR